ncbi:hypothetical protein WOLCODRAFT_23381 [Wolfiporia cocos MD-104 SS10]|uniref:Uncharacterized protein n=1 Tax=Wolfiporia cocos (strain MD-104) TaxID=742152 RepID=A0A2H3JR07_WOLCO|nr:hypothetical protein WOLCODRAFT_23381 [Wolfiporia cocos MD-104 SS10]
MSDLFCSANPLPPSHPYAAAHAKHGAYYAMQHVSDIEPFKTSTLAGGCAQVASPDSGSALCRYIPSEYAREGDQ